MKPRQRYAEKLQGEGRNAAFQRTVNVFGIHFSQQHIRHHEIYLWLHSPMTVLLYLVLYRFKSYGSCRPVHRL